MLRRVLVVVVLLYVAWRLLSARGRRNQEQAPGADSYSRFSPQARRRRHEVRAEVAESQRLVPCDACGTLVPESRVLAVGVGRHACGADCVRSLEEGT